MYARLCYEFGISSALSSVFLFLITELFLLLNLYSQVFTHSTPFHIIH